MHIKNTSRHCILQWLSLLGLGFLGHRGPTLHIRARFFTLTRSLLTLTDIGIFSLRLCIRNIQRDGTRNRKKCAQRNWSYGYRGLTSSKLNGSSQLTGDSTKSFSSSPKVTCYRFAESGHSSRPQTSNGEFPITGEVSSLFY